MEENREKIENIFSNSIIFEKVILHVHDDNDRSEIMHILSVSVVRNTLKDHINFLYIKDFSDFTLKQIVNILFKEIANEWISYAMEIFDSSKAQSLEELQPKKRIRLIYGLASLYYKQYKLYIFEEIADTFIELISSISQDSKKKVLITDVIESDLIANRTVLGINNFNQLYKMVKSAKNDKNMEISAIQIKISEIIKDINKPETTQDYKDKLSIVLSQYEKKLEETNAVKLDDFNDGLKRVKKAIINSLNSGKFNG